METLFLLMWLNRKTFVLETKLRPESKFLFDLIQLHFLASGHQDLRLQQMFLARLIWEIFTTEVIV